MDTITHSPIVLDMQSHFIGGLMFPNHDGSPTFGALPGAESLPQSALTFEFRDMSPDILNCVVYGPNRRRVFEIRTSGSWTVVLKQGGAVGNILWGPLQQPQVDVVGVVPRMAATEFLKVSRDQKWVTSIELIDQGRDSLTANFLPIGLVRW